jgi:TolB-like protein
LLIYTIVPCAARPRNEKTASTFDKAISNTTIYIKKRIPSGSKVVILNFKSDFPRISEHVIEELTSLIVNDNSMIVVDRKNIDLLQQELNFQYSGYVADEEAQAIGRQLGAQFIIAGEINLEDKVYRLRIRAIKVETAEVVGNDSFLFKEDKTVTALKTVKTPSSTSSEQAAKAIAQQSAPSPRPRRAPTWRDKWLWLGGIAGYSLPTYSLFDSTGDPSIGNRDFDFVPTFYGGYLSFQPLSFLALQVEADYISDYFTVDYGSDFRITYESESLMIPALLKLTLRPGIFLLQGYGGAYYNLPLGKLSYSTASSNGKFEVLPSLGWIAGGSIGIWIGLGVLYFDARVGDSFGHTKISDGQQTIDVYKRFLTSYSIGLEFGLFNKR